MIKLLLLTTMLMTAGAAFADPAPFGLELGKATLTDAKAKYRLKELGINKYSNGPMHQVQPGQISFEGLRNVTLIFDSNQILSGVLTTFPKGRFNDLNDGLAQKYRLVSKSTPFVGDSEAKYVNGQTEISISAPHMSFELNMIYLRQELLSAFDAQSSAEQQAKKNREDAQL
ncbi:hypothetical protein C7S18_04540 [Ahniella affigens]|uniref:Uncharacterized protein n=1 Tax=Ahniella affigens TaxID=2021234 RepID=A0A2P1PNU1_9GAMM|nr:hypothetical protein [Ahniella affigens]AVP96509.1 hypothetical protein C7S18_04540 [Ahniella affigens]